MFFARPRLSNIFFKQNPDDIFTISGQTNIATTSGLTLSDGIGGNVIITASGASLSTVGQVMTYDGSRIRLMQSSLSGDTNFACGTTDIRRSPYTGLNMNATTVGTFLEKFFFPDAPPTSNICFTTGLLARQFGDTSFIGTTNLCWSVTKCTNNICLICASTGGTGSYDGIITATGGSQNGLLKHTYTPSLTACPTVSTGSTLATYRIFAETISGETTTGTTSINWKNKVYWGGSSINYIGASSGATNVGVNSLTCSELASTGIKCFCNFCVGSGNFFYYTYPAIFGVPTQVTVNGLPNNSWGCASLGTLSCYRRCNSNGYCQDFIIMRSDNQISGSFNINITTTI
jgi:hypothetical protein